MSPLEYLALAGKAYELFVHIREQARQAGVSDDDLAKVTADYDARIIAREAEAEG